MPHRTFYYKGAVKIDNAGLSRPLQSNRISTAPYFYGDLVLQKRYTLVTPKPDPEDPKVDLGTYARDPRRISRRETDRLV